MTTWLPEAELAKELGLTRARMVAMRKEHLKYGYWRREKRQGRRIMISETGKEKLKQILASEDLSGGVEADTRSPNHPPAEAARVLLTITQVPMNPYIVYATKNGETETIICRVQSNLVYMKGDKLYAIPDTSPLYKQIGPKPRWRGDKLYAHYFI